MNRNVRFAALLLPLAFLAGPLTAQESQAPATETADAATAADNVPAGRAAEGETTIAHGIGIFGPPELAADFEHLPYVNPDAPKGGEISMAMPGGFDSYNPFTVRGRPDILSSIMLEPLMTGTMDEVGTAYCLICETIEYPESRDWVIFHLRPEAKFSDGTPVTAEDVMFSYETFRDKGLSSFRAVLAQSTKGAEIIDDHTIRFDFMPDYPRRDVIQSAGGLTILSKKDFEENDRDLAASSDKPYLGSGPYVFERADIGRTSVYKRNPDYWGSDLPINIGRNNFDTVRAEYFADSEAAFEAFKAGEYTIRHENSSIQWATGYNFPALNNGHVIKTTVTNQNKAPAQGFFINMRREKFQDPRVRQAIGLLFNFKWSNDALFYGLYTRTESFWDNTDLKATGTPSEAELALLEPLAADLPEGVLTEEAVVPPEGSDRQLDRRSLRQAAALLDEAGWVAGSDGMRRNANGDLLSVEFMNDNQTFDRIINPLIENLRAVGVDATMARVDGTEHETRRYEFDYDIIIGHAPTAQIAGDGLYQVFGSQGVDDVFNPSGVTSPAIDSLIRTAISADNYEEMAVATRALDRVVRAMYPWIPNWYNPKQFLAYYDQYEWPDPLPPYLSESLSSPWYLDIAWYNAEKAEQLKRAGALR
ncbi:extracellular solute-binding protein [Paracoccus albus]|uniref:extracellular solute-binding protein n=1 Tax=Paracoccus albus TaxID=3017784 RepID=UPI0022F02940|nr:extracellular solute-binding protein [Paracoccus albus]WBU61153.1 extracellular solute-binding protein [Paracoccus albus]